VTIFDFFFDESSKRNKRRHLRGIFQKNKLSTLLNKPVRLQKIASSARRFLLCGFIVCDALAGAVTHFFSGAVGES